MSQRSTGTPASLADFRWQNFMTGLGVAVEDLNSEPGSTFTIMTHPGSPDGCQHELVLANDQDVLSVMTADGRWFAETPAELKTLTMDLLSILDIERPDQVEAAFPQRVQVCRVPFVTRTHCPSGTLNDYEPSLLHRHVHRALIGVLRYSPHVDADGVFVIHRGSAKIFVGVHQRIPILDIWSGIANGLFSSEPLLHLINELNVKETDHSFVLNEDWLVASCRLRCYEFSAYNFWITLSRFFIMLDDRVDDLRRTLLQGPQLRSVTLPGFYESSDLEWS